MKTAQDLARSQTEGEAMIRKLENGWEGYAVMICRDCRGRLYQPGSADLVMTLILPGSGPPGNLITPPPGMSPKALITNIMLS